MPGTGGEVEMPPEVKFGIIRNAIERDGNVLNISSLCKIAEVSRSGYYRWVKAESARLEREEHDIADFGMILRAYRHHGYTKGARGIYMFFIHEKPPIFMNIKKIRRLMNKYGLACPIRRANPYRQMAKAMKTNTVFPNAVNREFYAYGARRVLLTDITYLFYDGGVCYLSTILDAFTREILAYEVSDNLKVEFVLVTVEKLVKKYGCTLDSTTIIHSDQGCHYTSLAFINKLKSEGLVQSMSRKGNCWDNAPQESFFGHMKDEIKYEVAKHKSFEAVRAQVDDWIDYYNNERYQWDLEKLSPREYYEYVSTGIYPLQRYQDIRGSAPNPEV